MKLKSLDLSSSVFIIAELSANHGQKIEIAIETIRAAKRAGADAIKLQTYTPDTMTIDCQNKYFTEVLKESIWEGRTLYDLYKEAYTPWEWHKSCSKWRKRKACFAFLHLLIKQQSIFWNNLIPLPIR